SPLLVDLWLFVLFMIGFAGFLMLAHAVIPSLVGTHHLPHRAANLRPFLYAISLTSFAIAITIFYNFATNLDVIYGIYGKQWI
ncbi:MAG: hypothetical protein NTZ05_20600, partial [Chloroflexi bacterium]|nr:hypothetical protein [Chloroflexota bacterium]